MDKINLTEGARGTWMAQPVGRAFFRLPIASLILAASAPESGNGLANEGPWASSAACRGVRLRVVRKNLNPHTAASTFHDANPAPTSVSGLGK